MYTSSHSSSRFNKTIAIITTIAFIFNNTAYAAPSSRSFFKNKKVDYKKLSTQSEQRLQQKKSIFQEGDDKKEQRRQGAKRVLQTHLKDLSQIHIPSEFGRIIEVYQVPSGESRITNDERRLIVHIQDLHTNPEAQLNEASILEILVKDYNLDLVCSEGADGEVDTSSVSSFPDYEVREKTALIFINSGELTAEEYLSITKYPDLPIWGVEDRDIYFQNIIDFNKIMKFSPASQVFISQAQKALAGFKDNIYTKELLVLDQKELDYENEKIETDEYLEYLTGYIQKFNIPTSKYRNISLLSETMEQEGRIDQIKIMQQSQNLLLNLQAILTKKDLDIELDGLMVKAVLFKDEKISPFSFYSYLKSLALKNIPEHVSKYPDLNEFVDYLTKVNSLDSTKLFNEIEDLSYEVKQRLAKNQDQKDLAKALRNIKFLEGFFNLKVSNEELDYYIANRKTHKVGWFKTVITRLGSQANYIDYNPDLIDSHLQGLEDFYKTVKDRDVAMVRNALSEIEKRDAKVAAFVSGGFHTKGITRMLREQGYSYIVVSPYSSTDIDEENYHFLLSGKRKPITELLKQLDLPEIVNRLSPGLRLIMGFDTDMTQAADEKIRHKLAEILELDVYDAKLTSLMQRFATLFGLQRGAKSWEAPIAIEIIANIPGEAIIQSTVGEAVKYIKISRNDVKFTDKSEFIGKTVLKIGSKETIKLAKKKEDATKGPIIKKRTTAKTLDRRPRLDFKTVKSNAQENLAKVLEDESMIFNKEKASEAIMQDLLQRFELRAKELQDIQFTLGKGFTGASGRDLRYLDVSTPSLSTGYVIQNSTGTPEWEFERCKSASDQGLGPQFVYSEAGKQNKYLDSIIVAKLENVQTLTKEEELLAGRRLAEKMYVMLDPTRERPIMHAFDALSDHIRIIREGEDIDVRFIDWGKPKLVTPENRPRQAEEYIGAIINEIFSRRRLENPRFNNPEVVLASFISRLREITLQHSEEELDFYSKILDKVYGNLTKKSNFFNKEFKALYKKANPLIGEMTARLGTFSATGLIARKVDRAMKGAKGWLERGWTIANHILVSFHAAFVLSVLVLPGAIRGEVLNFMFLSPETILSLAFLWTSYHTGIAVHEMGHYLTALEQDALSEKYLEDARKMRYESGLFKRLLWYAKMFILVPYGKFPGVTKTGLSYHPDAEYNLFQTAAGPRWSRNLGLVALPIAIILGAIGIVGGNVLPTYVGRLLFGMGAVGTLDFFFADPGEYKKLRQREHLAALRAEEAKKKAERAGRWIDIVGDVKKRMTETRPQKARTRDGLEIWAPWQFRNCGMGGRHTEEQYPESNISMQETMFNPLSPKNYEDAQEMTINLQTRLQEVIQGAEGCRVMGIGLEGGLAPYVTMEEGDIVPEQRLWRMAKQTILDCGYVPGVDVAIALDPACSELQNAYREEMGDPDAVGMYLFWRDKAKVVMTRDELYEFFRKIIEEDDIPIVSIEDGFAEDDDAGWAMNVEGLGDKNWVIRDDADTTKDSSVEYGADKKLGNAFLCKANQIGTLSETLLAILVALGKGLEIVVSHRSKSPNDDMEAHIALACFAMGLKTGGGANTERLFKYGTVMRVMAEAVRAAEAFIEEMPEKKKKEILETEKIAESLIDRLVVTDVHAVEESTNAGIPTVKVLVTFGIKGSKRFENLFVFPGATPLGTSAGADEAIHLIDSVIYEAQIPDGKYKVLFDQKSDGSYRFKKEVTQGQIDSYKDEQLNELYRRAQRYRGKGCLHAVGYVNTILAEEFVGNRLTELRDFVDVDRRLLFLERQLAIERGQLKEDSPGTEQINIMQRKGNIGMNAILSKSLATARLIAHLQGKELYELLREKLEETMAKTIAENGGLDILPEEIRGKVSIAEGQLLWEALNEDLDFFELKAGLQAVNGTKSRDLKLYELLREQLPVYKVEGEKVRLSSTSAPAAPMGGGVMDGQLYNRILAALNGEKGAIRLLQGQRRENPGLYKDQLAALNLPKYVAKKLEDLNFRNLTEDEKNTIRDAARRQEIDVVSIFASRPGFKNGVRTEKRTTQETEKDIIRNVLGLQILGEKIEDYIKVTDLLPENWDYKAGLYVHGEMKHRPFWERYRKYLLEDVVKDQLMLFAQQKAMGDGNVKRNITNANNRIDGYEHEKVIKELERRVAERINRLNLKSVIRRVADIGDGELKKIDTIEREQLYKDEGRTKDCLIKIEMARLKRTTLEARKEKLKIFVKEENVQKYAERFHAENLKHVTDTVKAVLDWEPEILGHSIREDLTNLYALEVVRTTMKAVLLNDPKASTFNPYAETNAKANDVAVEIGQEELINSLPDQKYEIKRWIKLAIGSGVIDLNSPIIREDYNADPEYFIEHHFRKAINTDLAHQYFEEDFERFYKDVVSSKAKVRLVYFLDNNGEAVFDLILIQQLMKANPNLSVYVVPKAQTLGNDISHGEVIDIITNKNIFREIKHFYQSKQKRFYIVKEGPNIQGVDVERISKELDGALQGDPDEKVIGMFAGQANFETTQGWNIPRYYKLIAKGAGMAMATGLPQKMQGFVFSYVPAGVSVGTGDSYLFRKRDIEEEGEELYSSRQTLLDFEQAIHSDEYKTRVERFLPKRKGEADEDIMEKGLEDTFRAEAEANEHIMEQAFNSGRTFAEVVFDYDAELYESLIKLGLVKRTDNASLRAKRIEEIFWGSKDRKGEFRKYVERYAGIKDLVLSQRIPDKEEAEKRARRYLRTIAIRTAEKTGKRWDQMKQEEKQEEFSRNFGSTQFVPIAGKGSRFSDLVHKGLFIGSQGEPNLRLAINGSYKTPGSRPVIFISMHQLRWIVKDEFISKLVTDMQKLSSDTKGRLPEGWEEGLLPEDRIDPEKQKKYFTEDAIIILCKPFGPGYYLTKGMEILEEQADSTAYKQIVFGEMASVQDSTKSNASLITYMEAVIGDYLITAGGKKAGRSKMTGVDIAGKGNFFLEDGKLVALTDWARIPEDKQDELEGIARELKNWSVLPGMRKRQLQNKFAIDSEGSVLINSNTVIFKNDISKYFEKYRESPFYNKEEPRTGLPLALVWDFIELVTDELKGKPFSGQWPIGFVDVGNAPSSLKDMHRQTNFSNQYKNQIIKAIKDKGIIIETTESEVIDGKSVKKVRRADPVVYLGDRADFSYSDIGGVFEGKATITEFLYLDSRAEIGTNVRLENGVRLLGKVKIGDGARISNAVIEGGIQIGKGCVLEDTVICEGAGEVTDNVKGLMTPERDLARHLLEKDSEDAKQMVENLIKEERYTSLAASLIHMLDGNKEPHERVKELLEDLINKARLDDYAKILRKMTIISPVFKRQSNLFVLIMDISSKIATEGIATLNHWIIIDAFDEQLFSFSELTPLYVFYAEVRGDRWTEAQMKDAIQKEKTYRFFSQMFRTAPGDKENLNKKRRILIELIDRYPISSDDLKALYLLEFQRKDTPTRSADLIEDILEDWHDEGIKQIISALIGKEALKDLEKRLESKEIKESEAKHELRRDLELVLNNKEYQELLDVFGDVRGIMNGFVDTVIKNTNQTFEDVILAQKNPLYNKTNEIQSNVYERPRILGIMGGSGGSPILLMENLLSKLFGGNVTMAVVGSPHDDGGSSRRAQDKLRAAGWGYVPSPGDPMNVLSSLTIKEGDTAKAKRAVIRSRFAKDLPPDTSFRSELLKILKDETDNLIHKGFEEAPLDWLYFVRYTLDLAETLDKELIEPGHLTLAGGSVGNFIFIAHHIKEKVITDRGRVSEGPFNKSMEKLAQSLGLSNNFILPSTLDPATLYAKLEAFELLVEGKSVKCKVEDENGRKESKELIFPRMRAELATGEEISTMLGTNSFKINSTEDSLLSCEIKGIRFKIKEDFGEVISSEHSRTAVDLQWDPSIKGQEIFKVQQGNFTAYYSIEGNKVHLELVEGDKIRYYFDDNIEEDKETIVGKPNDRLTARVKIVKGDRSLYSVNVRLDAKGQGTTVYFRDIPITFRSRLVIEQTNITESVHTSGIIDAGFVEGPAPTPNKKVLELIENTQEAIVLGPGSLITSILPVLLVPEIVDAICKRKEQKLPIIFLANPYKDNETVDIMIRRIAKLFEIKTGRKIQDLFTHMVINDPERATEDMKELMNGLSDEELAAVMSETRDAADFSSAAKKSRGALMITEGEMRELLDRVKILVEPLAVIIAQEVRKAGEAGVQKGIGYDTKKLGQCIEYIILEKELERIKELPLYEEVLHAYYGYIDEEGQQYDEKSLDYDIRRLLRGEEGWIFRPGVAMRTPLEVLDEIRLKREQIKSAYISDKDIERRPPKLIVANIAHTLLQYRATSAQRKTPVFTVSKRMAQGINQYLESGGILIIQTALKLKEIDRELINYLNKDLIHRIILAPYAGTRIYRFNTEGDLILEVDYSKALTKEQKDKWVAICKEAEQVYELDRYLYGPDGLVDRPVVINNRDGLLINFEMDNRRDLPEQLVAELNQKLEKKNWPDWEIPRITKKGVLNDQRDAIIEYLTKRFKEEGLPILAEKPSGSGAINTRIKYVDRGEVIKEIISILNREQIEKGRPIYEGKDIYVIGKGNEVVLKQFPDCQGVYFREEFTRDIPDNVLIYNGTYGIHGIEDFFSALSLMKKSSYYGYEGSTFKALLNLDSTENTDYLESWTMSRIDFVNMRKGDGVSERTADREINNFKRLGIIEDRQVNGKYVFRVKLTRNQLESLPPDVQDDLGKGDITRLSDKRIEEIKRAIGTTTLASPSGGQQVDSRAIREVRDERDLTPTELMQELKFRMDILGLEEDKRVLTILLTSLDAVSFVEELVKQSGKSEKDVLDILEGRIADSATIKQIPKVVAIGRKYQVRKAMLEQGLTSDESICSYLKVDVREDGSSISSDSNPQSGTPLADQPLSLYLLTKFASAEDTPFPYRDDMEKYIGRFLGLERYRGEKDWSFKAQKINNQELSDLEEEIEKVKGFLRGLDLDDINNFINNGIGANEMYLHQLSQMVNELADGLGLQFHWEVVDNPADFQRLMENCIGPTTKNTLANDESRSGGTTEPADFMEMTSKKDGPLYINKRIVWANGGRFHKLGEDLARKDSSASILHIDNTPGNIGGRHMNLKTGMVYTPLFTALAILGYKLYPGDDKEGALEWATEQLKAYVTRLYQANLGLTPKTVALPEAIDNPASQIASEMVRKRDVEGRVKLAMVFDPRLRHFATEYFQNTNEGIAKPAKGNERNNNMHSFWDASGKLDYMAVFSARPELYQPIFIVDLSSDYAEKMLGEASILRKKGIPVKVVSLDLKRIADFDTTDERRVKDGVSRDVIKREKFAHNLAVQANATALLQTAVTTFAHLTDQDANSNPAVKTTREVTAAIQDILVERGAELGHSLSEEESRVTFDQILKKMKETREKAVKDAWAKLDARIEEVGTTTRGVLPDVFQGFVRATLGPLAERLGLDNKELAGIFIGSISRAVFSADLAESGGLKSALVDVALESSEFGKELGTLTKDFTLPPLSEQVDVYKDAAKGIIISVACPEDLSSDKRQGYENKSREDLPQAIADYFYDRFQEENRINTLNTFAVGYMDADTGNENIESIMAEVNNLFAEFGINSLPMNFPRVAHAGIEAAQALAEIVAVIGLIATQSFSEGEGGLGSVEIRKGLTVNGANKIYVLSNVARMAFGGSPTVILEYRDREQLGEVKEIMVQALKILADKIRVRGPIKQQVDSMDQIIAVPAAKVIEDKKGFEGWIVKQPENIAVVIVAMADEYKDVIEYKDIAYIKVVGEHIKEGHGLILTELFGSYEKDRYFGGFKLGGPYKLDKYKAVLDEVAFGV